MFMSYTGSVHVPWEINFFLHLKKLDNDFFDVFNYGRGTLSARLSLGKFLGIHGHFSDS